jgi:PAS domain S-box-containing protein
MEIPVRPDDARSELNLPTSGLEQPIDRVIADLDRVMSDLRNGFATFDRQWRYTYANNRLLEIFKLSRVEVLGKKAWKVFPHQVGIEFFDLLNRAMTERIEVQFEFYYEIGECWVEHHVYPTADGLAILMVDVSERKQAELLLLEQQRLLELTASGTPMAECLAAVCASVSKLGNDVRACIVLADLQRETFKDCIAPTFPPSWVRGVWGAPIDELTSGTCAAAVYHGLSSVCTDIASDDSWSQPWRDLCLAHGVLACYSAPILNADGVPLGSLMLCFDTAREQTEWEYKLANFGTRIASIVFERDRSSLVLRESAAEYLNLFESIDEGFCIVEMMFDAREQPVDYRFVQANPAFVRLTGLPADALGKTARELVPDLEEFWFQVYGRVALTGESMRFENESVPMNRWFDVYASRVGDAARRRVAIVFTNITERKQSEKISQRAAKFDAFRLTLTDALRSISDPVAIQATASRILGEHLDANRVVYFEVRGANYFVERDYVNGATALIGNYPIDSFGAKLLAAFHSGRAVFESDVAANLSLSPAERDAYTAIQIGAYIAIPLTEGGEFVAGLAVHSSAPRVWTPDEVALVEEVAERTWGAIERARAEVAMRESEAKYRTLFESMDEGYLLMDLIFDANDRPVDLYYLEANPAAVVMMGTNPFGRRASELFALESHWMEILDRVVKTGIGERQEIYTAQIDTWYNFYVFKIGDVDSRRVAVIFEDVTERRHREANLAFLTEIQDEFARLVSANEIMQAVGAKIGAYLNVVHCTFADIDEAQEKAIVAYDWHPSDTPSIIGVYQLSDFVTEEFQQAARAKEAIVINNTQTDPRTDAGGHADFNVHAFVTMPCHRGNEWKYLLTVSDSKARDWREDEIALISELASRIFPRLERARSEAAVAANLRDTRLLRDLSARLVSEDDTQTLYREILTTAIALTVADAGTVRILDDRSQDLLLIDSQGFDRQMNEDFYRVNSSSPTSYGSAMRNGERAFVDFDVPEHEDPDGSMRRHFEAGYLSAQSTPLFSRTGKLLGMVSTHWRSHHRPIDRELRSLDLLARQAADLMEQQQITAALREREEQLRLASEAAKVGMWFWNLETDSLIWTELCKALFGLPAETEMSYAVLLDAIHPDDRQRTDAAVTRSIEEHIDYDIEYRCCWSDGSVHWIAAKGSCSYNPAGQPMRMMGVAIDITALKHSEFALRQSEEQLAIELADTQQLQHISSQLIREDDIHALYQQILDAAISLMGADLGSVQMLDPARNELRLLAWQGFDPASAEFWSLVRVDSDSTCGAALDSRERTIVPDIETCDFMAGTDDLNHYRLSGIRAVQSTPLISRNGRLVGMISTHWREPHQPSVRRLRLLDVLARQVADLLDRKQVEIALRESQERLSLVQLAAKIGAWDWEVATGTIYWSPEYYTLYGIDPAVVTPSYNSWLASILDADRDTAEQTMQLALQQQQTYFSFEFRTAHPAQGLRWIGARGQIFYNPDGQPQRVTGIAIDVTDRKQVEIALADRNQELDSFVYIVSHDLKAPLRAISNLSNWIEEDLGTDLPAATGPQMAQLRGRVQRMETMINGLLDYARVGRTDDQIQVVCVAELLAEILDSLAPPSTFEIFIAADLPTFRTKRLLLSQVFANLIGNAFKHHDKSAGFIRISCQERGDFYEFAIVDDGPGIASEQRDRIFIIFQSGNPQKKPDSTGIGLSIVKKIVETAGGKIRLESELGKGATFYFTWPK